jgi:hypothetical protein
MQIGPLNILSVEAPVLFCLALSLGADAKDKTPNLVAVQGKVFLIDKASSTIMVDTKGAGRRLVAYGPNTRFEYGRARKGTESSLDRVKETDYISCTGTLDDRERLVARECTHRESK